MAIAKAERAANARSAGFTVDRKQPTVVREERLSA
jgi:hypothetical protein